MTTIPPTPPDERAPTSTEDASASAQAEPKTPVEAGEQAWRRYLDATGFDDI